MLRIWFLGCTLGLTAAGCDRSAADAPVSATTAPASNGVHHAAPRGQGCRIGIELDRAEAGAPWRFAVNGLTDVQLTAVAGAIGDPQTAASVFSAYVITDDSADNVPPLLGSCRMTDGRLLLEPRFLLEPGLKYRARFDPAAAGLTSLESVVAEFALPAPTTEPTTVVEVVYPTADRLPANLLKFYVHFSAPMRRGGVYQYIHLIDDHAGREVELPFLELPEELWDPSGQRLTLLFDPGRIKRGLKPLEEVGGALMVGHHYRLVIDPAWRDAEGNPLAAAFEKPFTVGGSDRSSPTSEEWHVVAPAAGGRDPLVVGFNEPLDHALLMRVIHVADAAGERLPGEVTVAAGETQWRFAPDAPWQPGDYRLVAETVLEDLAGNNLARLFDTDLQTDHPTARPTDDRPIETRFRVVEAESADEQ